MANSSLFHHTIHNAMLLEKVDIMEDPWYDQPVNDSPEPDFGPECLALHCPPSMYVECEWPKCSPNYPDNTR
jgi:hypothetical protein